jgi:3-phenylpropionate/trans-cinnamate dioxygenase ferredoxin reductase component
VTGPAVVVGASLAGLRAAEALRARGWEGELVVVGAESRMPYTRPPLSKALLAGVLEPAGVELEYEGVDAEWRLGVTATGLDPERRRVALDDGESLAYEMLVVATGCRPRPWPGDGGDLEGLFTLRTVEDSLALRAALVPGARLAVIGAGFIGCEIAATARSLGVAVTLVDVLPHPMHALGPLVGEACARMHAGHGVELRLGARVAGLLGERTFAGLEIEDGTRIEADLGVVALGAQPNVEWLEGSGLPARSGLVCDEHCLAAGASRIAAAGDVATWPHPLAAGDLIRVEHWSNASEQAAVAAANLLAPEHERIAYDAVPSFWSDQYDVKLQAVGLPAHATRYAIAEGHDGGRFVAVGERDGRLVAAVGWNAQRRMPWYRRQIADGVSLAAVQAAIADDPKALPREPTTGTSAT